MYRNCFTERSAAQQRKYEKSLQEIMLEKPYEKIKVNDIYEKVGTTRKSFYHYFDNKEDCLCALIDHAYYDALKHQLPGELETRGYPYNLLCRLSFQQSSESLMEALIQNNLFSYFTERIVHCCTIGNDTTASNGLTAILDENYDRTVYYITGILSILRNWHIGGYQRTVYDIAQIICSLMPEEILAQI